MTGLGSIRLSLSLATTPLALAAALVLLTTPAFALGSGDAAPDFSLQTYDGRSVSLSEFADQTVVLEWFSFTCPFVKSHYREGRGHMQKLQARLAEKGIVWLSINSNKTAPKAERALAKAERWKLASRALLSDPGGRVGRMYGAKTTPEMFVIHEGTIVYHGAIDDEPGLFGKDIDRARTRNYVDEAVAAVLAGREVARSDTKPYGCTVKY